MCLIILANDVKSLDYKDLQTAYDRNKNGFGVMYLDKKENFISGKFVPKNFTELKNFFNEHKQNTNNPMALHFRFTTEGKTNTKNCHPFISFKNEKRTIGLMHNGARLPIPLIYPKCSDTWHYNEHYLKPLLKHNPNLILKKDFQDQLQDHIEQDKFLFLDSMTRKFIIINENLGNYKGANWFSNDYWNVKKFSFDTPKITYNKSNDNFFNSLDRNYNYDTESYYDFVPTNEELVKWTESDVHDFIDCCVANGDYYPLIEIINDYKKYIA
jgi:hypothetical protein